MWLWIPAFAGMTTTVAGMTITVAGMAITVQFPRQTGDVSPMRKQLTMKWPVSYNIYFIAFACALSGLLFGYDAGIISGAILFIKQSFTLSSSQIGYIVSAVPLGALIASAIVGHLSDQFGRKKILLVTAWLFAAGSLVCAFANSPNDLIFGRLLMGFAVGMSSSLSPVYIAEIAEKGRRGKLVTLFLISVNFGIFISYLTNLAFAHSGAWRIMLGLGIIPAAVFALFITVLPESPRWLIVKGKLSAAKHILEKTHGKINAQKELTEIQSVVGHDKVSFKDIFQKQFLKVLLLGAIIGVFTQAIGINAIIYYAPTIFQKTGFNEATVSIMATLGIGFTVTLAAITAASVIDKFGRRNLLLGGLFGIILSLCLIIFAFEYVHNQLLLGWLALTGCILFVACQGLSVGPACFLLPAEIYPAKIRGFGMSISITFNWLTNFLVALLFPIVLGLYGIVFAFKIFLLLSIVGWILFFFFVPETKNVSLENIELNILENKRLRRLGE